MAQSAAAQDEESPCVHVCLMDYAQGFCIGCCRQLDARRAALEATP
jgi:predicted Fe-S protein YdhL (DUF1289 family)